MSDALPRDELHTCVCDALYDRRMVSEGCFVTNAAAVELARLGTPALPAIEETIRREVIPHAPPDLEGIQALDARFIGLGCLLSSYLEIAGTVNSERAVRFLRTLPLSLQFASLRAAHITYRTVQARPEKSAIPNNLWELFDGESRHIHGDYETFARRVITSFYRGDAVE